jgi:hypothetical protein
VDREVERVELEAPSPVVHAEGALRVDVAGGERRLGGRAATPCALASAFVDVPCRYCRVTASRSTRASRDLVTPAASRRE